MKTGDGPVETLRMFKLAKASAIKARTQTINQLKAVLIAADPALREALTGLSNPSAFNEWARTFTDPRLCAAVVDRLTFDASIIETGTEFFRLRTTKRRRTNRPS
jgi:hypothetical protein